MKLIKFQSFMVIIIIICMITSGCIKEKTERADVPEWFLNIPKYPNAYVAVGSGDGRAESLCNALSELSSNIETVVSSMMGKSGAPKVYKNDTGIHFGKISVQSVLKSFSSQNGSQEYLSFVSTLSFVDKRQKYQIKVFYEETLDNDETTSRTHFEITSKNCMIEDVLDELKRSGIDIETYASSEDYFMKLVIDKNKVVLDKSKDDRKTSSGRDSASTQLHRFDADKAFEELDRQIKSLNSKQE